MTITEFRAKRVQLLDDVICTSEVLKITKRGKVVAELRSCNGKKERTYAGPGSAIDKVQITCDITEPIDIDWEVSIA